MSLRVGSHPSNLSLFVLRQRGVADVAAREQGIALVWHDYLRGGTSGQLLADGVLDVVGTGSTPPVVAAAGGLDVCYLASSTPRDANAALLVRYQQPLVLRQGIRLAAMNGSFTDHFVARLLREEGLQRTDITLLDLHGEQALTALLADEVDGWIAIDPWLTRALADPAVQLQSAVGDAIVNRSLFWTHSTWQQRHPQEAAWLLGQLEANDRWIAQHPADAAALLHAALPESASERDWLTALQARSWGIIPASTALIAEQQQQADDLYHAGFIAAPLTLRQEIPA